MALGAALRRAGAGPQLIRSRRSSAAPRSRSRRPACRCRELAPNAPDSLHRQARRHAVGHLQAVPEEPVALARAVGHEPRPDPQPAPDLSRARCWSSTRPAAARACASAARRRPTATRQAVAARAQRRARRRRASPSIPLNLIEPFLNEAVVFETNELDAGAAHRGDAGRPRAAGARRPRLRARRPRQQRASSASSASRKPLIDPTTGEVLGYEARYVGTAEYMRAGRDPHRRRRQGRDRAGHLHGHQHPPGSRRRRPPGAGAAARVHATTRRTRRRRRSTGQIVSIYGDALTAGQNQIVALNRGARDGIERGHVLALWRDGATRARHAPTPTRPTIKLPDERHGLLFVFRVFDRVSYALILSVKDPVKRRRPLHPALSSRWRRASRDRRATNSPPGCGCSQTPGVGRDSRAPAARGLRLAAGGVRRRRRQRCASVVGAQAAALAAAAGRARRAAPTARSHGSTGCDGERRARIADARRPGYPPRCCRPPTRRCCCTRRAGVELLQLRRASPIVGSRNPTPQGAGQRARLRRAPQPTPG